MKGRRANADNYEILERMNNMQVKKNIQQRETDIKEKKKNEKTTGE